MLIKIRHDHDVKLEPKKLGFNGIRTHDRYTALQNFTA